MRFNYRGRLSALRGVFKKENIDALVVVTIEDSNKNVQYLSGFGGTTGALIITKTSAVLAVDARYTERAQEEAYGIRVITIPSNVKKVGNFAHYVDTALSATALPRRARIAFEGARVPYLMVHAWNKHLKRVLIPTEGMVERLREVKDTHELKYLARAGKITSDVFTRVAKRIRAGQTEREVAQMLDIELKKSGAQKNSFDTIVASGPNSAIPHHETGNRHLKPGEPVVMDFGGVFEGGYCSDITRTIFVPGKKPHAELAKIYRIALEANKKSFRALRPGMTWKEYDAVARSYIDEKGYGKFFSHGLGHSIGLETHDPYDYARSPFREGTVLSNEPGIYISGVGGVRIEDDVVVTKSGARCLTPAPYLEV
ncbi:Xaa-Pro peptidase family protein [Patescibacteria group bacterium]|nr:Xaa-Pro peptidase family protein [Patescibacteria group bacterium]